MAKKDDGGSLPVMVLDDRLKAPAYATAGSAGLDLCACSFEGMKLQSRATVPPGNTFVIGTGVKFHIGAFDPMFVGMVLPRSSLGRRGLVLQNTVGIIDSDFQGEIMLACRNAGRHILTIDPTERIAQMLLVPVMQAPVVTVKEFKATARGEGGFGSTGK